MTTKDLDRAPLRCQRLLMRLMRFRFELVHVPGKQLIIADTLSRHPMPHATDTVDDEVEAYMASVTAGWPTTDMRLQEIKEATREDEDLQHVMRYVLQCWPEHRHQVNLVREYHHYAGELSVLDGILTYGSRIFIPRKLRDDILSKIHSSHASLNRG